MPRNESAVINRGPKHLQPLDPHGETARTRDFPTKNLRLSVSTYEIKTGDQHRPTRHINMESSRERSWLQSHMLWATLNGYSVEIMNQTDHDHLLKTGQF